MRIIAIALLASVGCSRSFTQPQSVPSFSGASSGIYLHGAAQPLPHNARVSAVDGSGSNPATLELHGANLASITGVLVGGSAVDAKVVSDSEVDFSAPAAGSFQIAQSLTVTAQTTAGDFTVGSLRFYLPPVLSPAPVNAPGQVVIQGTSFSPVAAENQLTFGASAVPVLIATSESLLVKLDASLAEGAQTVQLSIPLDGAPPLTATASVLVWKVVPPFWIDPPQAFAGEHVHFKSLLTGEPPPDILDDAAAASTASGSLDLTPGALGLGASPDAGNALAAQGLAANYQPSTDAGFDPSSGDQGDRIANAKLNVQLDGVAQTPPDINASNELSWTVPVSSVPGSHAVTVSDPAGSSAAASLIVLSGHLAAPAPSCWPLGFEPKGATARGLTFSQSQGDVLLWAPDKLGGLAIRAVHPGGGLEDDTIGAPAFNGAAPSGLVAAGHFLYVSARPGSAGQILVAVRPPGPPRAFVDPVGVDGGPSFMAVLEPNLHELYTWVLESSWLPRMCNWDGFCTNPRASLGGLLNGLSNCALQQASLAPEGIVGAVTCDQGLFVFNAPVPASPVDFAPSIAAHRVSAPPGADLTVVQSVSLGGGRALIVSKSGGVFVATTDGRTDDEVAQRISTAAPEVAAISPDGAQALLGGTDGTLTVVERTGPGSWDSYGFVLPGEVKQLAYDASGTHAVAVVQTPAPDGGNASQYCELR